MDKIDYEKQVVEQMIRLYCRHKHGCGKGASLCNDCQELLDYAMLRLSRCKFGNKKTSCLKCSIHCYKPVMRKRIAQVMRYSGPWMMLYHPVMTVKHLLGR